MNVSSLTSRLLTGLPLLKLVFLTFCKLKAELCVSVVMHPGENIGMLKFSLIQEPTNGQPS